MKVVLVAVCLVAACLGDVFLHGPRGSNNRLDEQSFERQNFRRLFRSENNNRGGYNVGKMYYYTGSTVTFEWTTDQSCGDVNNHCELVFQYMCGDQVRDGVSTRTIPFLLNKCDRHDCNNDMKYGMHENYEYFRECECRYRNKGLYTADQKLSKYQEPYYTEEKDRARFTRQNSNGIRYGYECNEERDYYPYWHPTPWRDIVVFTSDVKRCDVYKKESQNVKNKGYCKYPDNYLLYKEQAGVFGKKNDCRFANTPLMNNKEDCESQEIIHGGLPTRPTWIETGAFNIPAPECLPSPWSRENHHGNNLDGFMNSYNWTIPADITNTNCVVRLRYNVTAGEIPSGGFDPPLNASANAHLDKIWGETYKNHLHLGMTERYGLSKEEALERGYYLNGHDRVKPFKFAGENDKEIELSVTANTNQYGRTFQDRTHVFQIKQRPADIPADAIIHNLNVRGKRGNIVETYPAVEYDFQPNRLEMNVNDYLHIQWTGSNENPDYAEGQGRASTDRSNMLLLRERTWDNGFVEDAHGCFTCNYPEFWKPNTSPNFLGLAREDIMALAYSTTGLSGVNGELNDASFYFDLGPRKITSSGIWRYLCTRNNYFSNRSQKGEIRVIEKASN